MTLEEFESLLPTKSVGRVEIPHDELLVERIHTALKRLATDTVPLRLTVHNSDGYEILRRIDDTTYIRFPKRPIRGSGLELDIDAELIDALSYHVMAGLELQRSKQLMGMYWKDVDSYNEKLIETFLSKATNDAERYHVYP